MEWSKYVTRVMWKCPVRPSLKITSKSVSDTGNLYHVVDLLVKETELKKIIHENTCPGQTDKCYFERCNMPSVNPF